MLKQVAAGVLTVAYQEAGVCGGFPVILLHGFPYDVNAYAEVMPILASNGCRVITPYLRGFGATRFVSPQTPRSGQQAALGSDLLALMDALSISHAVLAGYDWGGRAACIVAALWPQRVRGLVSGGNDGYNIQDIAGSINPQAPDYELRYWYQFYFHSERGRNGLARNRHALCKLLWKLWSPNWRFDDATYDRTASSFDNPDFVDVVIHSYRHRYGLVPGDPSLEDVERRLAAQPAIAVPTVALHGEANCVLPAGSSEPRERRFSGAYRRHLIPVAGHNVPQEAPKQFAEAVLSLV
ncbi:MAG TPA: alpha/beta hydrolase [Burkholderiaceae bacterium]|nr:alpha/beta hydrolase [Burkholderiaceae bacterium]